MNEWQITEWISVIFNNNSKKSIQFVLGSRLLERKWDVWSLGDSPNIAMRPISKCPLCIFSDLTQFHLMCDAWDWSCAWSWSSCGTAVQQVNLPYLAHRMHFATQCIRYSYEWHDSIVIAIYILLISRCDNQSGVDTVAIHVRYVTCMIQCCLIPFIHAFVRFFHVFAAHLVNRFSPNRY